MSKYIPIVFESPFDHLKYTLIRNLKQLKHLDDIDSSLITDLGGAAANANFIEDSNGNMLIVVYMPKHKGVAISLKRGLIIHESVHIWQEIKTRMNEKNPSIEFEAYSIQRIAQDLIYLLEKSEV